MRLRFFGALLALSWTLGPIQSAQAVCAGVTVVVEFRDLPGRSGSQTGCAADPSSGISALQQAGFAVSLGTGSYGGGFVCALNSAPETGCEGLTNQRYWSYWYQPGGSETWQYSQQGAASRKPNPGDVEAWVWQSGGASEPPSPRARAVPPVAIAPPVAPPKPAPGQPAAPPAGPGTAAGRPAVIPPGSSIRPGSTASPDAGSTAAATSIPTSPNGTQSSSPTNPPSALLPTTKPDGSATNPTEANSSLQAQQLAAGKPTSGWPWWTGILGLGIAIALGFDLIRRTRATRKSGGLR